MDLQPTWAVCVGGACIGCSCPKHPPWALHLLNDMPEPAPVWIEFRSGFAPVIWCRCGAAPAPPELVAWHRERLDKALGKDERNGDRRNE
jgi:hypothetical protein